MNNVQHNIHVINKPLSETFRESLQLMAGMKQSFTTETSESE